VTTNTSNKITQDKTKTKKMLLVHVAQFLIISVALQTTLASETVPADGQWLKEQLDIVNLLLFRVGT
jgi:hypothetical protein